MIRRSIFVLGLPALLVAACGGDGSEASSADRTIAIDMRDNAYRPARVEVTKGETVRFVFRNRGKVAHDAFIGDEPAQVDHEMEMSKEPAGGMDHGGGDDAAITVESGEEGELTHTFDESDETDGLLIGCHEPGHYEGGMKVAISVT